VQVPCDEDVAIHIGPESCAVAREGLGEALTGVRIAQVRAEIALLAADGMNNCAIAATLGVSRLTVGLWRKAVCQKALRWP
jgi:DNA-binding NarL/FixJ family response regulator